MNKIKPFEIVRFEDATPEFYAELGFKSGLECHQQLFTAKKLFCRCPAGIYSEDYDAAILRHMRPTLSEMGTYDGTALMEFKKKKDVLYMLKSETVCTYEMDDTPPFLISDEALEKAVKIAMLFGCNIVGEVHVMRKQYLDGSIPTGFQRTLVVGVNGEVPMANGKSFAVTQVNLEEDSCREVSDIAHRITFRTDRLSMPLIEVITDASLTTPQLAYEACRRIQTMTRFSGLMRRGAGASRQDVNGSVAGGSRVEIKGVPRIPTIPKLLHYEAIRQKIFLDIRDELLKRTLFSDPHFITFVPITANPTVLKSPLFARAEKVIAVVVREFADLFLTEIQPGRTFADDVSSIVSVVACMDQMPNMIYGPRPDIGAPDMAQWASLRKDVGASANDLVTIVWGNARDCDLAASEIRDRIIFMKDRAVPEETRRSLRGGNTVFERVLPGADRMYPDTDHPPVALSEDYLAKIRAQIPASPWDREKNYESLGLSAQLAFDILREGKAELFEELVDKTKFAPSIIASALTEHPRKMRRKLSRFKPLSPEKIAEIFETLEKLGSPHEAVALALEFSYQKANCDIPANFTPVPEDEARHMVNIVLSSPAFGQLKTRDPQARARAAMGLAMKFLRGKFPGAQLENLVKSTLSCTTQ